MENAESGQDDEVVSEPENTGDHRHADRDAPDTVGGADVRRIDVVGGEDDVDEEAVGGFDRRDADVVGGGDVLDEEDVGGVDQRNLDAVGGADEDDDGDAKGDRS